MVSDAADTEESYDGACCRDLFLAGAARGADCCIRGGNVVRFTSTYLAQEECEDVPGAPPGEGGETPITCRGPGGYTARFDFSACCMQLRVEGGRSLAVLFPEQTLATVLRKKRLEWRLADGVPFAVIFRIDLYRGDPSTPSGAQKKGELLTVKGLDGFTDINHEIDVSRHPDANKEARRLADRGYLEGNR